MIAEIKNPVLFYNNKNSNDFIDNFIWILFLLLLAIDSFNGFFLNRGIVIPISQYYKIFLLLMISYRLISERIGLLFVVLSFFYLSILLLHLSFGTEIYLLGDTINHLVKFIATILVFFYAKRYMLANCNVSFSKLLKVFKFNTFVLVINVLIGFLGFGYTQYDDSIGYKGYFFAGNELSGVMLILFPFLLFYLGVSYSFRSKVYLCISSVFLLTSILIGTKTGILVMLLSLFFVPKLLKASRKHRPRCSIATVFRFLFSIAISFFIIGGIYYGVNELGILDRWTFFYEDSGLLSFLSGRDQYLMDKSSEYLNSGLAVFLLGLGGNRTVEMDPFDSLLNYGIVGLVLVYSFYFYLIKESLKYKKRNYPYAALVFYIDVLILMASSFSGHILFSGMANTFIALVNSLIYYRDNTSKL